MMSPLKLVRTLRNRFLQLFAGRRAGLNFETDFWDDYFRTRGGRWPEDYRRRLDPSTPLDPMHRPFIDRLKPTDVRILDVGAGPLTGRPWQGFQGGSKPGPRLAWGLRRGGG